MLLCFKLNIFIELIKAFLKWKLFISKFQSLKYGRNILVN